MKNRIKVWTLAWDNKNGTDCRVFSSEAEWLAYFKGVMLGEIINIQTPITDEIRRLLNADKISDAYALWQAHYKDELDTYNWGCEEIEVELAPALA